MSKSTTYGRFAFSRVTWALALVSLPSWAATQLVTNTNDSGAGSLRAAVASAASGDTVSFSLPNPSTVTLSSPITISTSLTINGPGAVQLAISGNHSVQVFFVSSGTTVAISGLTIRDAGDSAIVSHGMLTISSSTLSGNAASSNGGSGGAVNSNVGSVLNLVNCTLTGNSAVYGGAIANYGISATITSSAISGNSALNGGAIDSFNPLTIAGSTISNNSVTNYGGGIYSSSQLIVTGSTISGNSAAYFGGGIDDTQQGTVAITNSTISGNSVTDPNGQGGGIMFEAEGPASMSNTTVSGNSAPSGGGILLSGFAVTGKGILLAGNSGGNCGAYLTQVSQGYNLSDDNTCTTAFNATTDQNGVAAGLDPKGLQNNGGPTQTIALLPNSPAVDAIPVASCTDTQGNQLKTDQRGIARPQGSGCDIGAFELVENVPFSSFTAWLGVSQGKCPGFNLIASFSVAAGQSVTPLTEAVTLTIGSYSVSLPAGSFQKVQIGPVADYAYAGTINNVKLEMQIAPLGGSTYGFQAAATPVTLSGSTSSVPITLTIGQDTGTTTVTPVTVRK